MQNHRLMIRLLTPTALAAGSIAVTAPPAHAICYADLVGAGYGAADYCSDYANGAYVQVGRGVAQVTIYCNGALRFNRYQYTGNGVLYSMPASGCAVELILTARDPEGDTDAFAYVD